MKKNKFLALSIILCMLFSLAVMPVGAETVFYTLGNYTYSLSYDEAIIEWVSTSKLDGNNVGLPSVLNGYPVTGIGDHAFASWKELKNITIPSSVKYIGDYAFYNCSNLRTVTMRNGITTIYYGAFLNCTSLTSITIPDSVKSIGNSAFHNCSSLASITIPNGVTSIEDSTFRGCSSLTSIFIPDSVTSIGISAFDSCSSLTDVYYSGSEEDWNKISISSSNTCLTNANRHYYNTYELTDPLYYSGETLMLLENAILDIGENLYFRNGYVNAENGYIKAGEKKITGNKIYFDNNGKMRLDAGYTAKVERDNGDGTTDQGFMAGMQNSNSVITMTLGVTGVANDIDYTGRTISKDFDFTNYEVAGLVNFGFTVNNIPKPLILSIQSIE